MLHPLVDAIKVDNPELFNGLLAEASKTFPEINEAHVIHTTATIPPA